MKVYDIREKKTATAIKRTATAELTTELIEILSNAFGSENVAQVGNKEIGFIFGTVVDKDGCEHDLIYTINPIVKDWDEVKNAKSEIKPIYDLFEKAEEYQKEKEINEREKQRKREQKQKQIERDKARRKEARDRQKAEKERQKAEAEKTTD